MLISIKLTQGLKTVRPFGLVNAPEYEHIKDYWTQIVCIDFAS